MRLLSRLFSTSRQAGPGQLHAALILCKCDFMASNEIRARGSALWWERWVVWVRGLAEQEIGKGGHEGLNKQFPVTGAPQTHWLLPAADAGGWGLRPCLRDGVLWTVSLTLKLSTRNPDKGEGCDTNAGSAANGLGLKLGSSGSAFVFSSIKWGLYPPHL